MVNVYNGTHVVDNYYEIKYNFGTDVERSDSMLVNSKIYEELKRNNNIITTARVLELGFSRSLLSKYVKEGLLERSQQGVYILMDAVEDDMYMLMLRSEKIIFSHDTALFLHGLSERTPFAHSVTIPSNSKLSKVVSDECTCYYVKPELHNIGEITLENSFGNRVRCYNVERTICDIIRSRSRLDEETVISAIKNYAASKDKDLNLLAEYATLFGIEKILKRYLEVLL